MLEDDGFVPIGRVTFEPPARLVIHFDREDAKAWGPALYAFRVGNEVVRIGKCEATIKGRMIETERLVSRALSGNYQKGGANPWEAFEWRRRLLKHGHGELLAREGPTTEERALIKRYNPPLCNDSPCARLRPPEARSVKGESGVTTAITYWQRLNEAVSGEVNSKLRQYHPEQPCALPDNGGDMRSLDQRQPETIFQDRVMLVEIDRFIGDKSIFDAARYAWKASLSRAKKLDYVLAVRKGVIVGVFVPTEWLSATPANFPDFPESDPKRIGFHGCEAPPEIQARYRGRPAPVKRRGDQSPLHYYGGG